MNRRERFLKEVARAAREARPKKPRGARMPENLSAEGRRKGLQAIKDAPRCQSIRRDGKPCSNAAVRGARRCASHGGRVEVPDHPANIRRFFNGTLTVATRTAPVKPHGQDLWEAMTGAEQRDLLKAMPQHLTAEPELFFKAVTVLHFGQGPHGSRYRTLWLDLMDPAKARKVIV
jgi:hypothetical protein